MHAFPFVNSLLYSYFNRPRFSLARDFRKYKSILVTYYLLVEITYKFNSYKYPYTRYLITKLALYNAFKGANRISTTR
jgi:hypothetical protein